MTEKKSIKVAYMVWAILHLALMTWSLITPTTATFSVLALISIVLGIVFNLMVKQWFAAILFVIALCSLMTVDHLTKFYNW